MRRPPGGQFVACICGHAESVAADIAAAMQLYSIRASWTAESLAFHTQAVLQGAFVLAKAKGGADHLRRYIELLFKPRSTRRR